MKMMTILIVALVVVIVLGVELFIYSSRMSVVSEVIQGDENASDVVSSSEKITPEEYDLEVTESQQLRLDIARFLEKFRIFIYGILIIVVVGLFKLNVIKV